MSAFGTYSHFGGPCDTFKVTTTDGKTRESWERNLCFKTDSSEEGPDREAPAIINAGMMGDRASVIFSSPEEISRFIVRGMLIAEDVRYWHKADMGLCAANVRFRG